MSCKYITVDETQATSLAEANILAKQHDGLHWKVNRSNPGHTSNGTAVFQCNSQVNCPSKAALRVRLACIPGVYYTPSELSAFLRSVLAYIELSQVSSRVFICTHFGLRTCVS